MQNVEGNGGVGLQSVQLDKKAFDRWRRFKQTEDCQSDSEAASLLLKWYEIRRQSQWNVECVFCHRLMSVSLTCERPHLIGPDQPSPIGPNLLTHPIGLSQPTTHPIGPNHSSLPIGQDHPTHLIGPVQPAYPMGHQQAHPIGSNRQTLSIGHEANHPVGPNQQPITDHDASISFLKTKPQHNVVIVARGPMVNDLNADYFDSTKVDTGKQKEIQRDIAHSVTVNPITAEVKDAVEDDDKEDDDDGVEEGANGGDDDKEDKDGGDGDEEGADTEDSAEGTTTHTNSKHVDCFDESKMSQTLNNINGEDTMITQNTITANDKVHEKLRKQHKCDQCGKTFHSLKAKSIHTKKTHNGKLDMPFKMLDEDRFECAKCKQSFLSKTKVLSHTKYDHKSYLCGICQRTFNSSASLKTHRLNDHKGGQSSIAEPMNDCSKHKTDLNLDTLLQSECQIGCPECSLTFENEDILASHTEKTHLKAAEIDSKKSFVCHICDQSFKLKRRLNLHLRSHSSNTNGKVEMSCNGLPLNKTSNLQNSPCNANTAESVAGTSILEQQLKTYQTEKLSDKTTQQHPTGTPFSCSLCKRMFKSKTGLHSHKQQEHLKQWPKTHTCDLCDSTFRFKNQLTKHRRSHRNDRPFSCKLCKAKFKSSASLSRHTSWHEDMRSSVCHLCGQSCVGLQALTQHLKLHHGTDHMAENPYKCSECTATFSSLSKLTSHAGVHRHGNSFVCTECGQAFRSQHTLTVHKRKHTGERPFQCSDCPSSFMDKSGLKRHQLQHASSSKSAELCHVCGASFPSKAHLSFHVQRHTAERPYKCSHCGKAYKTTGDLTSHMMSHSDLRPFPCQHCDYAARTQAMLNKHARKHTGERPYNCEQCSASFAFFSCLSAHRKLHSNSKPFVCEVCDAAFFTAYNLRLHTRKHSGERPYKCPHCSESFSWHSGLKCHLKKHQSS